MFSDSFPFLFILALLYVDEDDEAWMDFATYLGFNEEDVEQELAVTTDPIMAILNMYRAQGRDPKDFVRAMYETSRKMNLRKGGVEDNHDDTGSEFDAFNVRSYSQQSTAQAGQPTNEEQSTALKKPALKPKNSLEGEGINLMGQTNQETAEDLFDAATVVLPGKYACFNFGI